MSRLVLRFHDDQCDGFDWTVADSEGAATDINWQQSSESELGRLLSQHPLPVVLVIPQQYVYLTEFELPEKTSRQVLTSIEYQIEDQLAQDTEAQHYSIGRLSGNKVPVVVVEQAVMLACQSLQQKFGLRVVQILPEMYLCPWGGQSGEVGLLPSNRGLVLRYGEYRCVKCLPEVLPSILDLINRQVAIEHINCYVENEAVIQDLNIESYSTEIKSIQTSVLEFASNDVINLQQRQFQASSNWIKLFHVWKGVAAAAMVLLAIALFNRVMVLQDMEDQLQSIKVSQYALIKDHVGPQVGQDSNLKKEMIKLLQQDSSATQKVDFVRLLLEFSQARVAFSSIEIVKIGYQRDRLSIDISSKLLNDVEALHAALNARGLSTSLDRLNIKPELVLGQFVLQGGDNG